MHLRTKTTESVVVGWRHRFGAHFLRPSCIARPSSIFLRRATTIDTTIDIAPRLARLLPVESESLAEISIGSVENSDVRSSGHAVRTLLYAGIRIGPVVKKDVMKASIMLEHDSQYATILAFDVKIERDAQELADALGVKIFQADIIYHLFDKFTAYREELKQRKRDEHKHIAVFPCKLKILPQYVFNSRDPIVIGVMVEAGIVKEGTPLCVPSKDFVDLGMVTSIEYNHKPVESARKGQEVCIKIEPIPGEAPKMFGRHFEAKDFLISKISRQSIDACKDYFRDDLLKTDWQLMVELKKLFQIL